MLNAEPIPPIHKSRYAQIDACLQQIKFDYYPGIVEKAAMLFYMVCKNHPLENGNKRTATSLMMVFLALNDQWLKLEQITIEKMAIWVVDSHAANMEAIIDGLQLILQRALIPFDESF